MRIIVNIFFMIALLLAVTLLYKKDGLLLERVNSIYTEETSND